MIVPIAVTMETVGFTITGQCVLAVSATDYIDTLFQIKDPVLLNSPRYYLSMKE